MTVTATETRAFLDRREHARQALVDARTARLRGLLPRAAERLRSGYGATSVCCFGSLATGRAHARSDVDLAVRGVAASDYFFALAELTELFDADVDLVDLDLAQPTLVERVAREGVAL